MGERPPKHKFVRAEGMRINSRKNFNFSLNFPYFYENFLENSQNFLKSFKIFKICPTLTNFSQITIINLI